MNQPGSGSGKGGGAGGSIREAGGAFGTAGAAKEEAYFRKQQADQLEAMRKAAQQASQGNAQGKGTAPLRDPQNN